MQFLHLPLDVFRKVLQQVIVTLGVKRARRLRLINSFLSSEIDDAIITTFGLTDFSSSYGPYDHGPANTDFMARYMQACINSKRRGLRVRGGLLDVINCTAAQLMGEPEIKAVDTPFEDVVLDLCRMVLNALGFSHVLAHIGREDQQRKSSYPSELENETFHSTAHLLPAAIYLKLFGMTSRLLENNLDLNIESAYFWSPLCAAAFTGQVELTQLLLDKGADPYVGPAYRALPNELHDWSHLLEEALRYAPRAAAIRGHDTILHKLFRAKDPGIVRRMTFKSFLIAAVRSGRIETIQTVNEYDSSLLESPEVRDLVMYEACARGHTAVVEAMLEGGMSVDIFSISPYDAQIPSHNRESLDPLKVAASFGHVQTVELLLAHGAPLQRSEEYKQRPPYMTAFTMAVKYGYQQVSELLVEHGADFNAGILKPLYRACGRGQAHMVRLLLKNDSISNHSGRPHYEPERVWQEVELAIRNGYPSVAKLLRQLGIQELSKV